MSLNYLLQILLNNNLGLNGEFVLRPDLSSNMSLLGCEEQHSPVVSGLWCIVCDNIGVCGRRGT